MCEVVGSHDYLDFSQKSRFRGNCSNKEAARLEYLPSHSAFSDVRLIG